jgi:hypothetical protein
LKKKPRTGVVGKEVIATGSLLTPLLDDVSFPCLPDHASLFTKKCQLLIAFLLHVDCVAARDEGDGQHRFPFYRVPG